ncbi:lysophospholipid acyltransferase family protein [Balneola sp. MJW-20]|uniref:lysophospholipid acyltransferase family protein n=1 Tax=Gracilimonas aurantiaca TaxID=3234185 RepID=UPI00346764EF
MSFNRNFEEVWVRMDYKPTKGSRTVYFLNHHSWWDGLIPLYLNKKYFHQKARAIMEDTQMVEYGFFSKIGAFSIDLSDPRKSIRSLRYAKESLVRENSCLFIYPEGRMTPLSYEQPTFKPGLVWLYKETEGVDFVPVSVVTNSYRFPKPELYIHVGNPIHASKKMSKSELNHLFEKSIKFQVGNSLNVAGKSDIGFEKA